MFPEELAGAAAHQLRERALAATLQFGRLRDGSAVVSRRGRARRRDDVSRQRAGRRGARGGRAAVVGRGVRTAKRRGRDVRGEARPLEARPARRAVPRVSEKQRRGAGGPGVPRTALRGQRHVHRRRFRREESRRAPGGGGGDALPVEERPRGGALCRVRVPEAGEGRASVAARRPETSVRRQGLRVFVTTAPRDHRGHATVFCEMREAQRPARSETVERRAGAVAVAIHGLAPSRRGPETGVSKTLRL
mmetsp:Transcript_26169/g.78565  ORF Transcript_26169/g.78565 Transcript_26169/m.78565 type:complete len:249 (+) Transcript_26169:552-1298(+)